MEGEGWGGVGGAGIGGDGGWQSVFMDIKRQVIMSECGIGGTIAECP